MDLSSPFSAQRSGWRRAILLALLLICFQVLGARTVDQSSHARFDEANKLYEQGKYKDAIAAYQALVQEGVRSEALFFNLGNAYFRSGQTGQAIAAYRLAQRLAPRDPDIRANLRFARDSLGTGTASRSRWQRWLSLLTLEELTLVAAGVLWLWFGLLVAQRLRRDWARMLRPYVWASGLATGIALAWLGLLSQTRLGQQSAIIVVSQSAVRYGPFEESQSAFTLKDGAELSVLNRKEQWLQVSDSNRRIGWLDAKDVVILPQS